MRSNGLRGGLASLVIVFFSTSFINLSAATPDDSSDSEDSFDFYLDDFVSNELPPNDKMAQLIANRLSETIFSTNSETVFKSRIRTLQRAAIEHPEKMPRFSYLNNLLEEGFSVRLAKAKKKRILYSIAGAVIGAVVALPTAKIAGAALNASTAKVLLIAIPAGVLAGAGAGYLLANLLVMPDYQYTDGMLTKDLQALENDLGIDP